jgi:hypothetical protein
MEGDAMFAKALPPNVLPFNASCTPTTGPNSLGENHIAQAFAKSLKTGWGFAGDGEKSLVMGNEKLAVNVSRGDGVGGGMVGDGALRELF